MGGKIPVIVCMILIFSTFVYADNLDIKVYTEDTNGKHFGTIVARPGATVNGFIYFENTNQDRSDDTQVIENIEVSLTIEEIEEGDDFTKEYDDFDLDPRRTESLPFTVNVPYRVEEKAYKMHVEYSSTENNLDFSSSDDFDLRINKNDHELRFSTLSFSPSQLTCNGITDLNMEILNIGSSDEEVTITIQNANLGISIQRSTSLESYPNDDSYAEKFPIRLQSNIMTGTYPVEVILDYGKNLHLNQIVNLQVTCGSVQSVSTPVTTAQKNQTKTTQSQTTNQPSIPPASTDKNTQQPVIISPPPIQTVENNSKNNLVIVAVVLLIAIVIAIAIILILKRKQ